MIGFYLVVLTAVGVCCVVCAVAGFGPVGTLDDFVGDGRVITRSFDEPVASVMAAYRAGVDRTAGMSLVEERDGLMLVDLRPTVRILGGNFGMALRLSFQPDGTGSVVVMEARNKVRWTWSNHEAALLHAERELRMNSKRVGLVEAV